MDTFTYPPVLVPPIMSKYSHGFGGESGSMISMSFLRMESDDSPRTPPPSRDRRRRSLLAILDDETLIRADYVGTRLT